MSALVVLLAALLVAGGCGQPANSRLAVPSRPPRRLRRQRPARPTGTTRRLPIEARVDALLAQMTVDEKIGQMTQLEKGSVDAGRRHDLLLGSVLSGGGGAPAPNDPAGWYAMVDGLPAGRARDPARHPDPVRRRRGPRRKQRRGRHDLPAPSGSARPATRSSSSGSAGRRRSRWPRPASAGTSVRSSRSRRTCAGAATYEGFGEDPLLVGDLGAAFIRGLQGDDLTAPDAAVATAKHFARRWRDGVRLVHDGGLLLDQGVTERRRGDAPGHPPRAVRSGDRRRREDRHGLVLEHGRGQGPRRSPPADRDPQGRTRVQRVRRLGLGRRRPGRPRLRRGRRDVDLGRHRHGHGPLRREAFQDAVRAGLACGSIDQSPHRRRGPAHPAGQVRAGAVRDSRCRPTGTPRSWGRRTTARSPARRSRRSHGPARDHRRRAADRPARRRVLLAGSGADDIGLQSGGWTISWQGSDRARPRRARRSPTALGDKLGDRLTMRQGGAFAPGTQATSGSSWSPSRRTRKGRGDSATLALAGADLDVARRASGRSSTG